MTSSREARAKAEDRAATLNASESSQGRVARGEWFVEVSQPQRDKARLVISVSNGESAIPIAATWVSGKNFEEQFSDARSKAEERAATLNATGVEIAY